MNKKLYSLAPLKKGGNHSGLITGGLVVALIMIVLISMTVGKYGIKLSDFIEIGRGLLGKSTNCNQNVEIILWNIRGPRVIAAMLVGFSLSIAGATYQGLFKNPMVSPDLLGASSGAGFGAAIALLLSGTIYQVQLVSFAFGLIAVILTYSISSVISKGENTTLTLVLTGMVISTLFSSFISITKFVADPNSKLPEITFWLMGGLSSIDMFDTVALVFPVLLGIIPILLFRYQLNALSFGEEEAKALGVNTKALRLLFIICATLMTSASVAISGMIGWVGLVIPHLARMLVGPNYKVLLPVSGLLGGIYLLVVDDLARCLFSAEIPLGIMTSIIGAPFFIYLLLKGKKGWI